MLKMVFWLEFEEPYNQGFQSYYDVLRAGGAMS